MEILRGLGEDLNSAIVAEVVDGDNDGDAKDAGTAWIPGETFTDAQNGISISVTGQSTTGYNVSINAPTTFPPDQTAPKAIQYDFGVSPLIVNETFPFAVYAMDDRGPVESVEFLANGQVIGTGVALDGSEDTAFAFYWDTLTVPDGKYTIKARVRDAAGNAQTTSGWEVIVDNYWPSTTITSGPAQGSVSGTSATFKFEADDTHSTFRCKLDNLQYQPCNSGQATFTGLANGQHTFQVYAVGSAGEDNDSELSPVTRTWTVDATKPTVTRTLPTPGARNVAASTNVISTFSERMNPSTINGATVLLKRGSTKVAATVSYNPNSRQAILNPRRNLVAGATYTATVTVGTRDLAGNALAPGKAWSFKVKAKPKKKRR